MPLRFNPFTGNLDWYQRGNSSTANQAPKLIAQFNTDISSAVGDIVRVNGDTSVTKISTNSSAEIPNGIFGIITAKPSATLADVIFIGIQGGYSGLTISNAVYVNTDGTLTQSAPSTGTVQQIGFAISATELFLYPQQPIRRAN